MEPASEHSLVENRGNQGQVTELMPSKVQRRYRFSRAVTRKANEPLRCATETNEKKVKIVTFYARNCHVLCKVKYGQIPNSVKIGGILWKRMAVPVSGHFRMQQNVPKFWLGDMSRKLCGILKKKKLKKIRVSHDERKRLKNKKFFPY